MAGIYVALIHYPVYDAQQDVAATSLVSLDIHDIARTCITFGVSVYYVVHPIPEMRQLGEEILEYWLDGPGQDYRPDRKTALGLVQVIPTILNVLEDIEKREGKTPIIVATSARPFAGATSYDTIGALVRDSGPPVLILLGTGHGLTNEIIQAADYILRPIHGAGTYNHLSVRSAAAIILDRLVGDRESKEQPR